MPNSAKFIKAGLHRVWSPVFLRRSLSVRHYAFQGFVSYFFHAACNTAKKKNHTLRCGFSFGGRYRTRFAFSPLAKTIVLPPSSWRQATVHRTVASKWVRVLSLNAIPKRKTTPFGVVSFLVDDIGLEPMTFRTSSGCSSQLS